MKTAIYKLTSKKIAGGAIYVSYRLGKLQALDLADAQPTPEQVSYLLMILPPVENALQVTDWGSMVVVPIPERTVKDKIKLFCAAFKDYRKVTYQPTQTEASNIRTVPVSQELLTVFFETGLLDYSIRNYIARINTTRDILKNGRNIKERFPAGYDRDFYNSLSGERLVEYKRHLRDNGWVYDGKLQTWKEAPNLSR
ncbi:hypothetical protein [Hymenobacter glacieicola]|uniref:Uncharacterized protein n=1 Tax=Hymenobacter glacieicola TaxID=1562124 RepID=A0ABQ1WMD4_9BACT|nr:hypothetical protein [Hymenobacter glacieicola]GGG33282.1 hypothetical protein GCM10011378_07150 [Hymenobacter glacieicola]